MKKIDTLTDAFIHELSDISHAEKQLIKALPKFAEAATSEKLSELFEIHLEETQEQIFLIDKVVELCNIKLKREKCDAIEGLIKEGSEIIQDVKEGAVRDLMLIAAAQKVEHYEIASYGCLVAVAKQLGFSQAAEIFEKILSQEKLTDERLKQLAVSDINKKALQQEASTTKKGKTIMARYDQERQSTQYRSRRGINNMPERDEEGRFMSDNDYSDRGRSQNNRSSSRFQRDDYMDNRSYSSRSNRDDDYDNDYEDNRSFSNYDEDDYNDNRSYLGNSQDYNDRLHSSSRRGNESRGMSNRSDYFDDRDDGGYRSRARSSGQGRGWFGDPEGHAEAGRHSHDNDRSGNSSRSRFSSSRHDNSRYNERGSGQGRGWFGDSEGHAEAGRHSHDNDRGRNSSRR